MLRRQFRPRPLSSNRIGGLQAGLLLALALDRSRGLFLLCPLCFFDPLRTPLLASPHLVARLSLLAKLRGSGDRFVHHPADHFLVAGLGDGNNQSRIGRGNAGLGLVG